MTNFSTPNPGDLVAVSNLTQVFGPINDLETGAAHWAGTTSGSVNAYTASLVNAPSSLTAGLSFNLRIHTTNTGASTLNLNGLGDVSIRLLNSALTGGELVVNATYKLIYDGTYFQVVGAGSVALADITDWPAGVSATEVGYLDNASGNIQTQINGKEPAITTLAKSKGGFGADISGVGNGLLQFVAGALQALSLGSALQVLRVDSGGTALEFAAASGGGGIVGVSEKTADYTLLTDDKDYLFSVNSASNRQITVDGSLDLPVGGMIHFSRAGTGEVTIAASGATVNSPSGLRLRAQHSMATLVCVATDTYLLTGDTKV